MYNKTQKIHFVGIGGIGMSGIAELLLNLGYQVSGSDLHDSAITRNLQALGGIVHKGHEGSWVEGSDVVVTSSAISSDNPEVVAALEAGIPVIQRAEMLAELMRLKKYGIAIAGSHGKTSTTSMVSWMMARAGLDPTIVVGGKVDSLGGNAKLGQGEFLVAEADESDGSFLKLSPVLEVVTNIDLEHMDHYDDIDHIKSTFLEFIDRIPFYGAVILCLDDANIADILPEIRKRKITYGMNSQADLSAEQVEADGGRVRFTVRYRGEDLGDIDLALPGRHNVYNSLAVICVGIELAIPFEIIREALASFQGVQRRMQFKGEGRGITVLDDYGHHPTEIRATLAAIKEAWPEKRLVVLFQPHRYSRTLALLKEFRTSFHQADLLIMTEIYAASEKPLPDISGEILLEEVKKHGQRKTRFIPQVEELANLLLPDLEEGDLVLTLGAGNIVLAGEELVRMLEEKKTKEMEEQLRDRLSTLTVNPIKWDCSLAPYTSFGIGGPATALITVESVAEIERLLQFFAENNLRWSLIGKGTNLLVADNGFAGIVLVLGKGLSGIAIEKQEESGETVVRVGAGCSLARLLTWCLDRGLSGLEFLSGIPGSLGGAVVMNAGAWGGEMADVIVSVTTVCPGAGEKILGRKELKFSYRLWEDGENDGGMRLVVAADLQLQQGVKEEMAARCRDFMQKRLQKQPKGLKNAGSFFKNPPGDSAGRLIEASGLKGKSCGGAMVSPVHANFLVNTGRATAKDVLCLMEVVRQKVAKDTGITLETEVHFL